MPGAFQALVVGASMGVTVGRSTTLVSGRRPVGTKGAPALCKRELARGVSGSVAQVLDHCWPVSEVRGTERDHLTVEPVGAAMARPVVDQEVAAIEILVVGEDKPLVSGRPLVDAEVQVNPLDLVLPSRRVVPRCRRQYVGVEE